MSDFDARLSKLSPEQRRVFELRMKNKGLDLPPARAVAKPAAEAPAPIPKLPLEFSVYFFSGDGSARGEDKYRLLIESAKRADRHGLVAVWAPERHFHPFGGLYPNPTLLLGALAMVTERVQLRAGSVVIPLHNAVRLAEDWSMIDNLSGGRVAMACASGWHPNDFALAPGTWEDRRGVMERSLEIIDTLWKGGSVKLADGVGKEIEARIYPRPLQPSLPLWMTTGGSVETFVSAGARGANLLTAVLGQSLDEVKDKVKAYRDARARHGHDPEAGIITLMMHCYIADSVDEVRDTVRAPFGEYLKTYLGLEKNLAKSFNLELGLDSLSPEDLEAILDYAFSRYFSTSALFGSPESCQPFLDKVAAAGVDEIACLVDFGIDTEKVLGSLDRLAVLQSLHRQRVEAAK